MPKNDHRYHHHPLNYSRERHRRVLYDSEIDDHQQMRPVHSRSRSRSEDSDQRSLSHAFLKDLCAANSLIELEKNHPKEVAELRAGLQPPKNYDPYHLTPLPVLVLSLDVAEEIRNSQKVRRDVRLEDSPSLQSAKDALRDALLKDFESQARLEAVEDQLKKYVVT